MHDLRFDVEGGLEGFGGGGGFEEGGDGDEDACGW